MTGYEAAQNALMYMNEYRYIMGAKGEVCSAAHVEDLISQNLWYFNTELKKTAARANTGYPCADCSGYVSLCTGSGLKSSYSLHDYADERRALVYYYTSETGGEWKTSAGYIPIGAVLWKSGHVGIYVGNQEVVEARSEELNVEKNNVNGRGFTYCLLIPGVQYEENLTDAAVSVNATVGYIPWIGKIINADLVYPSATPSASSGAAFTGMLLNGA